MLLSFRFSHEMAAGSSSDGLITVVDDFYFSLLAHGRNDGDTVEDELFPISDKKYAAELQLQEVIMSSAVATIPPRCGSPAAAASSNNAAAEAAASVHGKGECSYASSSRPSTPPLAFAAAAAAVSLVFCKICMDAVPPSDAHRASRGCAHAFCGGCLARYVGAKIQERIADVGCPEERCGGALDPELCDDAGGRRRRRRPRRRGVGVPELQEALLRAVRRGAVARRRDLRRVPGAPEGVQGQGGHAAARDGQG